EEELLAAQAEEIAHARLRPEEEGELQAKKNILIHAEKLYQGCLEGEELLYEGESALVSRLGRYGSKLRELASIDDGLQPTVALLESALAQLEKRTRSSVAMPNGSTSSPVHWNRSRTGWRKFTA